MRGREGRDKEVVSSGSVPVSLEKRFLSSQSVQWAHQQRGPSVGGLRGSGRRGESRAEGEEEEWANRGTDSHGGKYGSKTSKRRCPKTRDEGILRTPSSPSGLWLSRIPEEKEKDDEHRRSSPRRRLPDRLPVVGESVDRLGEGVPGQDFPGDERSDKGPTPQRMNAMKPCAAPRVRSVALSSR